MAIQIANKQVEIEILPSWYTVEYVLSRRDSLFIFGDNTKRYGMAGQATIRKCFNATGIATKFTPGMGDGDFFTDLKYAECCEIIVKDIEKIKQRIAYAQELNKIVFPIDGLGTGLSMLPQKAPRVWKFLCEILWSEFGVVTDLIGKLKVIKKG